MTAVSGSTRAPSCVTTAPWTSTRPAEISCSQARLLATPASASTFCSRGGGVSARSSDASPVMRPLSCILSELGEILLPLELGHLGEERRDLRQLLDARETHPLEEVARRPIEVCAGLALDTSLLDE